MDRSATKFFENLRRIREEKGVTQEELADRCDFHRNYIGLVERGKMNITLDRILKLAKALGVSAGSFFVGV